MARLGDPRVMASRFPRPRPIRGFVIAGAISVLIIGVSGTAGISGGDLPGSSSAQASSLQPTRAWALGCVSRWNDRAHTRLRHEIADGGPFTILGLHRGEVARSHGVAVGVPIRARMRHTTYTSSGSKPAWCTVSVTFKGHRTQTLILSRSAPDTAWSITGSPTLRALPSTTVNPDGTLSTDVRPPAATHRWGSAPTLSITGTSNDTPSIRSERTCFTFTLRVASAATVTVQQGWAGKQRPGPAPMYTYWMTPKNPQSIHPCFYWHGHMRHPDQEYPGHPSLNTRIVRIATVDSHTGEGGRVTLHFGIEQRVRLGQPAAQPEGPWMMVALGTNP